MRNVSVKVGEQLKLSVIFCFVCVCVCVPPVVASCSYVCKKIIIS
jgi:hypothetical protein